MDIKNAIVSVSVYVTHIFIVRDLRVKPRRRGEKEKSKRIDARFLLII